LFGINVNKSRIINASELMLRAVANHAYSGCYPAESTSFKC